MPTNESALERPPARLRGACVARRAVSAGGALPADTAYYLITLCVINNTHSLHSDLTTRKNSKNEAGQSRRRQQHSGLWHVTANQYEGHDDLLRGEA